MVSKALQRKRVSDCHRTETDNGGSVATLQLPRGSLAGCSSWRLRFALYSNGVNSTGGRPHGSGMVFALLAFCGVFAAPATMFPKDKRMFSSSHDRNVDRVQAVARRFTLSTKLIVTSLFRICLSRYGALS